MDKGIKGQAVAEALMKIDNVYSMVTYKRKGWGEDG